MSDKITKKRLLGTLLAALPTAALSANVKIYGLLDQGLVGGFGTHIPTADHDIRHNWGKGNSFGSRTNFTSRFGYESFERVSDDLEVEVRLESTIDPEAKFAFDRHAYVGLNTRYGTLRLGRTRDLINGSAGRIDPFTNDGLVEDKIFLAQLGGIGLFRIPRAVTYISPSMAGLQFSAQYGFGKTALNGNALKLLLTYDVADWGWHVGIDMPWRDQYADADGNVVYHQGPRARNIVAGAQRKFGQVKVGAQLMHSTRDMNGNGVDPALPRTDASPWGWIATMRVPVQVGELKFVLVDSEQVFNKAGAWQPVREIGFGYEYFLSKDTMLYVQLGREQHTGGGHWHSGIWKRF